MFILLFHSYSIVLIWEALNGAMLCVVIYPWNWGYDSINGQTFRITEFSHKICTWIVLHRIDKYTELVLLTMTCFYPDTFRKRPTLWVLWCWKTARCAVNMWAGIAPLGSVYIWILLYAAFCTIMALLRQKEARKRDYALLLFWMTSRVLHSAQYHRQHYTLHAFEQFGALHMHSHDDKYSSRPGYEPGTPRLQAQVDTNEPSGPATGISNQGISAKTNSRNCLLEKWAVTVVCPRLVMK